MAQPSATISFPSTSITTFQEHLAGSTRILAILGAGLSASSGLSTFQGVGGDNLGYIRDRKKYAKPEAFAKHPDRVWCLYQEQRRKALAAQPNAAHVAIAKLATMLGGEVFMAVSVNIDGLGARAGHPPAQLLEIQGSLFDIKCSDKSCEYVDKDTFDPDFVRTAPTPMDLQKCPKCSAFLHPSVARIDPNISTDIASAADAFIARSEHNDLVLVLGTTAQIWPASEYFHAPVTKGARIAMVSIDRGFQIPRDRTPYGGELGLTHQDWLFLGDPAHIVPDMLKPVVGELQIT